MARPVGSFKNPELSHQQELLAWLNVNKRIRIHVERIIALFEKKIQAVEDQRDGLDIDEMLNMMGGMREMLATSVKTVEGGLKQRGPQTPEDSAEDVLKLLEGGKGG